ncbi:hypothetical protein, partial [Corynebacterium qintianiae]|uniref:hypothetical protein n=1 Tax=Corynebacterium qintianiae TaxID=2709392 RepID=UPI00198126A1
FCLWFVGCALWCVCLRVTLCCVWVGVCRWWCREPLMAALLRGFAMVCGFRIAFFAGSWFFLVGL